MKTYSAEQIADYFLAIAGTQDNDVSNLKLQKLCYYAQGLVTAMRNGTPLFSEPLEAWDHGPVVATLYRKYKAHGSQPITAELKDMSEIGIEEQDQKILDDIYQFYGQYSAWRLRDMTHEEKPWMDSYKNDSSRQISLESLVSFFTPQIDDDYVIGLYGKTKQATGTESSLS